MRGHLQRSSKDEKKIGENLQSQPAKSEEKTGTSEP